MTLNRSPSNFFDEVEQVAYHPGHVVRGIDFTDDPLLHGRLFSYLDTQLTRLGGPNFAQIPINRPHAPVNDNHRDGFMQQAIHVGRAPYSPNSVDGGCPFTLVTAVSSRADGAAADGAYVHVPRPVQGAKVRRRAESFGDHFSQATLFWNSMTDVEREHIVGGFSFELSKVADPAIVERMLGNLANVDAELCTRVAANLGQPVPEGSPSPGVGTSPALSMVPTAPGPIAGRVVALLAGSKAAAKGIEKVRAGLDAEGAKGFVVGPRAGTLDGSVEVHKTIWNSESVEFDAVVVCDTAILSEPKTKRFLDEAYRHCKTIAAWGDAGSQLGSLGIDENAPGVGVGSTPTKTFLKDLTKAIGWHRHWARAQQPAQIGG
jgi:catalase